MINETLTIKADDGPTEMHIEYFDNDRELCISILKENENVEHLIWLSPNEVNSLITHLAKQLQVIDEPVDLLKSPTP